MATAIKQGEAETVHIKINRGKEFKETVKVKAEAPTGIQVASNETTVAPSEKDVNLKVAVAKDIAPGEHVIRITATPETGKATSLDLKVKVADRSESLQLALKAPSSATTIKQGESKTIQISFEPHEKYLKNLVVNVKAPKGLDAELEPRTIRPSDKGSANLRVTVDKAATLGEHVIHLTGDADGATVSPVEVKVNVIAP
jgi:uncharacterized membrane protein